MRRYSGTIRPSAHLKAGAVLFALLAALALPLYGCGKGEKAPAEGQQASTAGQYVPDKPDLEKGKEVYFKYCHFCHGQHGYGDGPVGIALSPHPANFVEDEKRMSKTDQELFKSITEGIHKDIGGEAMSMPRWQDILSEHERWSVLAYIRFLQQEGKKAARK